MAPYPSVSEYALRSAIGLAAAVATAFWLLTAPAAAESPASGSGLTIGERPSVAPAEDWTVADITALARALGDMNAVMLEGRSDLVRAAGEAERQRAQREIFARLLVAIEEAGLTVERYNALIAAMNRDPEMRARVAALLEHAVSALARPDDGSADPVRPAVGVAAKEDAPAGAALGERR